MEVPKEIVLLILENIKFRGAYVAFCKVRKDWRRWIKESITCKGPDGESNYNRWRTWFDRFTRLTKPKHQSQTLPVSGKLRFQFDDGDGYCEHAPQRALPDGSLHGTIRFQFGYDEIYGVFVFYRGTVIKRTGIQMGYATEFYNMYDK